MSSEIDTCIKESFFCVIYTEEHLTLCCIYDESKKAIGYKMFAKHGSEKFKYPFN